MRIWISGVALAAPAVIGFALLRRWLPSASLMERLGIAIVLAIGATSTLFFLWRLAGGTIGSYVVAETIIAIALLMWHWRKQFSPIIGGAPEVRAPVPLRVIAVLACAVLITSAVALVAQGYAATPHGEWDAWAIWNLRAAFMAARDHWRDGFTAAIGWSHPDYPLLLPSAVARLWVLIGEHVPLAAAAIAWALLAGTVAALVGTLHRLTGRLGAALGLALLLVPEYVKLLAFQIADVPLGVFLFIAVCLLSAPATPAGLVMAGAAMGFTAWTKNEGIIPALTLPAVYLTVTALADGVRPAVLTARHLLAGLAPMLLLLVVFRATVAVPADLPALMAASGPIEKLTDVGRHRAIISYMVPTFMSWGGWSIIAPSVIAMALILVGCIRQTPARRLIVVTLITVVTTFVADYSVYVLTPYDVTWHMTTSWSRLIAQMWPAMAFIAALGVSHTPPAVIAAASGHR